jgi:hypothetical protein
MANSNDDELRRLRARGAAEHVLLEGGAGLVARWRTFVRQVEKGYRFGLADYRNDLDLRSLIAFAGLDSEVEADDECLRRMLINTGKTVWSSDVPGAFWVQGYPKNASGELLEDLKSEGI